ncbi:MAG: prolyl oligopeptidase family serine peptidase [Bacteroidales bacterium]
MKYLFHGLFIIFSLNATGQNTIPYLIHEPIIDGYANEMQPGFRLQAFKTITKSNPNNPDITAGYYLAHNEKFLYLYLEAHADSLIVRDRGYQNGDGFHFLIGKPQKNNEPTDEFYVLGFSAGQSWSRKMIWYYNIDLQMQRLSRDTKFETGCKNGKISFELLLPWKEVHPYHPWFSVSAGFNICFVKAIGEKEKNYYFMEYDNRFQSEQSKKKYRVCHFEKPEHIPYRCSSMLSKCHISKNENPVVRLACFTTDDTSRRISITIASGENATVVRKSINLNFRKGFNELEIPVDNGNLIPGGYRVEVFSGEQQADRHYFSVFPDVYPEEYRSAIRSLRPGLSEGTYHTLMFYINEIDSALNRIKNYESSYTIRKQFAEAEHYLQQIQAGKDPFKQKKGTYRRAYRAGNKLYPYSVFVPEDYTGEKKYPLLVYLHGSGDDDRVLSRNTVIPEGFIVLAPNGRGTSNCFAVPEAQADIEYSITDVIQHFTIDTTKIILSGFSMGGYGVYRTYYEHPERYRAIAIISGHPDLARRWINPEAPNFLQEAYLTRFRNVPVFIFHGTKDLNCPFELTEKLVQKLRNTGCHVTFVTDHGGHGGMNPKIRSKYYEWLRKQSE